MSAATILLEVPRVIVAVLLCVHVPLLLAVVGARRLSHAAIPAGLVAAGSLWLDAGLVATLLVAPYAVVCALAGLLGVRGVLARWTEPAQLAMHAGLVVLAGAAVWLVAHRAGIALLGYPPFWVLLTCAHFHVAGACLAVIIGHVADPRGPLAQLVALGCVLGVPLTAAGIAGPHWLEVAGALVMAGSAFGAAMVLGTTRSLLLRLASLPLAGGMVLAAMYALRAHGTALMLGDLDPLASMIITHGVLDTTFALLALLALVRTPSRARAAPPLSRVRGTWPIGATFFARAKLERPGSATTTDASADPRGLVDALEDLVTDCTRIPAPLRAFYEHTGAHELVVRPQWRTGFRLGARLWARFARRVGQLQLPVAAESGREGIASRIVALDASVDGRVRPRAWIRTYPDGRALYVAAYATHRRDDHSYMNIAFPLPGGHLSSVLRMEPRGTGVTVSTRLGGDCGIWLVLLGVALRLPLSETIDVWTTDDPDAPAELRAWAGDYTTIARHDLWLCGIHYLTLEYAMRFRG